MHQLKIGNIPLPTIFVCERLETKKCRELGIPYIIKPTGWSDEMLIKAVLWRPLYTKFPHLPWDKILGFRSEPKINVVVPKTVLVSSDYRESPGEYDLGMVSDSMEISDDYRMTGGGREDECHVETMWEREGLWKWMGCGEWQVDIETLQQLHLLPTFLDDVATAIKRNLIGLQWADGWNKKLDCNMGRYDSGTEAPNLIVLDVSGSIPRGVSATMVTLIDTLRTQANADLIITGHLSQYWKSGESLPDPRKLAQIVGGCNERSQFYRILRKHILGRHWGNVIVFGDNDAPSDDRFDRHGCANDVLEVNELQKTRIDNLLAFHTSKHLVPGYGLWAEKCVNAANITYDTSWVKEFRW